MIIRNSVVVVYDIEIFPNVFHCTCKDTEENKLYFFEISDRKNQLTELVDFFFYKNIGDKMFCGYNNKHYDDVIINYLIDFYYKMDTLSYDKVCTSLYNLSNTIITSEEGDISKFKRWKYAKYFYSMDLLTMLFSSKLRVGLKEMQVTMHYKNVEEYSGDFSQFLPDSEIDSMIKYNINDVESTTELLSRLKDDVQLRLFIEKEYGIDALSMDSVKFGETLLLKKYCEQTKLSEQYVKTLRSPMDYIPLKDVILPFISYKNPKLQDVLEDMKSQVVYSKERKGYEKKFVLSNVRYSVGVGGIHSLHTPQIFVPNGNEYIGHSDVASMYPSFIIKYKWIPRHLGKEFWQVYSQIYKERIEAKHSGQKLKNLALKLTLNSVTGKMQQETSWMYDPFSVFKIRINGQLILLMLVDRLLELNCKIVQVNTDGVMYIAQKTQREAVQEAVSEVEQLTQLTFESDDYEAFYQYAINDYFGVEKGYSQSHDPKLIEKKGMFITDPRLGKGLAPAIIPKAVINYFLTKQPTFEYIKSSKDIKDFMMYQRVDKKFKVLHGDEPVQRINRFYASTNDYSLFKVDDTGKVANMLTKSGVTILNEMNDIPIENRHINYQYYIGEANKIISEFVCQQLELFL
ncbi:DNA polymerase [uncultured phage cr131_1]|uniref:DNA polymerase n=1 Tax=uncultured phage cr131_1 TaxID=2772093 RepID=A0A7M1RTQ0_9CAUD|nr:DNA polymerase [uncultured phage cr131_1]QOR57763.1 DNA polymerase [uncultured phage cr131_1]